MSMRSELMLRKAENFTLVGCRAIKAVLTPMVEAGASPPAFQSGYTTHTPPSWDIVRLKPY